MRTLKICFFAFALLISGTSFSQIALRGGVNLSNVSIESGDIELETDQKAGIQAGIMYTVSISDKIAVRPGAIVSVKGFKFLDETGDLTYLEVPFSFLFYLGSNTNGLYIELGPYAGTELSNSFSNIELDTKTLDLGLNVGVGLELGNFGVGVNYGYGIANLIDGDITSNGDSMKNKNIGLFGYIQF